MLLECLAVLGVYALVLWLGNFLWNVFQYLSASLKSLVQSKNSSSLRGRFGDWAVVTGSTDGVGKEYAKELAKRGINIVLISRTQEKLEKVAKEIKSEFNVETKIIAADFSQGRSIYARIEKELKDIPVGILVNNVGVINDYPEFMVNLSEDVIWNMINVNIGSVTMMCQLLIPSMKKRGKGAIVNISSVAAHQPLPLMAVYAATKSYCSSLTHALRLEHKSDGIIFQNITPSYVITRMTSYSDKLSEPGRSIFVPTSKAFTKQAVETLGKVDSCTGYFPHELQTTLIDIVPIWIRSIGAGKRNMELRTEYFERERINQKKK